MDPNVKKITGVGRHWMLFGHWACVQQRTVRLLARYATGIAVILASLPCTGAVVPGEPPVHGDPALRRVAIDAPEIVVYRAGEKNDWELHVRPELADAYAAYFQRDADAVLQALDSLAAKSVDPLERFVVAALKADALMMHGRAAEVEAISAESAQYEMRLTGQDTMSRAIRGLARMQIADFDGALAVFGEIVRLLGGWSLPTSYSRRPPNLLELRVKSEAQLRAYGGIASIRFMLADYEGALRWAEAAEGLYNDIFHVVTHRLYGTGTMPPGLGEGRAYNLAIVGGARSLVKRDAAAGAEPLAEARRFFQSTRHVYGEVVLTAIEARVALELGAQERAEQLSHRAERLAAQTGLGDLVWQLAAERGHVLLALGRKTEAEAAFRSAQSGLESAAGALATDTAKLRFLAGKEELARALVQFDLERNDLAALFGDLERARARVFVDSLGERPIARGRQSDLVAEIRELERKIRRQRLLNGAPGGVPDGAARLATLLDARTARIAELRRRDPELADMLAVSAAELTDVQRRLRPGEMLAYVIPGPSGEPVRLLQITGAAARLFSPALTLAALEHLVRELADSARALDTGRQKALLGKLGTGLGIGEWKVERGLYVVPSGPFISCPGVRLKSAIRWRCCPTRDGCYACRARCRR